GGGCGRRGRLGGRRAAQADLGRGEGQGGHANEAAAITVGAIGGVHRLHIRPSCSRFGRPLIDEGSPADHNPLMNDLEQALRRRVEGDVRFDTYSKLLYSTDASMYQMEPMGVVIPRSADDVQAGIEGANQPGAPPLPRGGGTSLTGQTVNHAVVLDFSRYMAGVLEVNREELWARVQPGLVQDELNHHVRPLGLLFGPDTSTSNRATIGGMLGNNSGGSHSIAYGLTVEHV